MVSVRRRRAREGGPLTAPTGVATTDRGPSLSHRMKQPTADDIREARESVQRIVDVVACGELAAGPRLARSLEGRWRR